MSLKVSIQYQKSLCLKAANFFLLANEDKVSFSNIKRFLDYISLILKHTFNHQLSLVLPLNEKGEIWKENIKFAGATKNLQMDEEIKSFFNNFSIILQFF